MSGFGLQGFLSHFFSFRSTLKLIKIIPFGLVQTKPVQSKTASLGPGPVRPSGETGPDQALPQTGSVRTGGIIALVYRHGHADYTLREIEELRLPLSVSVEGMVIFAGTLNEDSVVSCLKLGDNFSHSRRHMW